MDALNRRTTIHLSEREEEIYCKKKWQWEKLVKGFIAEFKDMCTETEWAIISMRWLQDKQLSWREIAKRLNLSHTGVRKKYKKALYKYRDFKKGGLHEWKKNLDKATCGSVAERESEET